MPRHVGDIGCLLALFAGIAPGLPLMFSFARPDRMDLIFTSFVWPVLGIIFLPFTTLIYVLLSQPGTGVTGWDWWRIALAVALDLAHRSATRNSAARPSPARPV